MKVNLTICLLFVNFLYLQVTDSSAQQTSAAISQAISMYHEASAVNAGIYNGPRYQRFGGYVSKGHPYFITDTLSQGSVKYDGILYDSVKLLYDELLDQLITTDITGKYLVTLLKNKTDSFFLLDHAFVHLRGPEVKGKIPEGYYVNVYSGKSDLFKKEVKIQKERVEAEGVIRSIDANTSYYVRVGNDYRSVVSSRSLMNAFGSDKKKVDDHLRKSNLKFSKQREAYIIEAVQFYDNLIQ